MKIGGKAKAEIVNQNLQEFQIQAQQEISNLSEESRNLVTEALSKIKGLKVKAGQKKEKMAEVD